MNKLKPSAMDARKRFAAVKARGFLRSLRDNGAIDLASIMVGVLVMGILGAVIAAAVFAVIPWSQDNAATGNLDAVKTAESVQYTMSSGRGGAKYADDLTLESNVATAAGQTTYSQANGNAAAKTLLQDNTSVKVVVDGTSAYYVGVSKSATGKRFAIFSDAPSTPLDMAGAAYTAKFTAGAWNTITSASLALILP